MGVIEMSLSEYLDTRKSKWPEISKYVRESNHRDMLLEALASMFVREGLPDDLDGKKRIEEWLLIHGAVAYVRPGRGGAPVPVQTVTGPMPTFDQDSYKRSKYRVGWADFGGMPYPDGIGSICYVNGYDGYVEGFADWRHNDNIVVAFNNKTYTPDFNIIYAAEFLTEYDISLKNQIIYSRLFPIPTADDDKTAATLQEMLDDMHTGRIKVITSKNVFKQLCPEQAGSDNGIEVVQLSDPKASDHIQYLDHGKDDILRWFWRQYGMDIQASSKMAQQTVDEVRAGSEQSMIIPHERYHCRQEEAAELKRVFGWDVTIEFTEPWQNAFAKCEREEAAQNGTDEQMGNTAGDDRLGNKPDGSDESQNGPDGDDSRDESNG